MKQITWDDRFSVGVKEIDQQHRGLLDILNRIIDSIQNGKEWKSTSEIIDLLINYAYNHFATEERYMRDAEYPDLTFHVSLHLEFIRKVFEMSQEAKVKGPEMQREELIFLAGWYNSHILGVDRKYMDSLAAKGFK